MMQHINVRINVRKYRKGSIKLTNPEKLARQDTQDENKNETKT